MPPESPLILPPSPPDPADRSDVGDQAGDRAHRPSPWAATADHPGYGPVAAPQAANPWPGDNPTPQSWFKRRVAPIGAAIIALAAKFKAVLLLLPKLKLLTAAGSMVVSILAYTTIWGLAFAVGFVLLLLVHEMGHVIALRREGIPASAPMFIPFLGAVITSRSLGDNAAAEARVGLAGPILGSLGAAACIVVWQVTGHDFWRALAFTGLFLNLFNLLPVVPLDGGRAMAAMAPWMWGVGLTVMVGLAVAFPNPVILIIVVFAALETWRRWKLRRTRSLEQAAYYRVKPRDRALIAAVYLGLIVLLVVGMDITHLHRTLG
ncbi:MAG TPA: site-2 protease family protein [Solirubrobacteraceae bacterium]|nr:site-2 protease family protein [Solirubrobacteraceae bacterium]